MNDRTALEGINESMEILEGCIKNDMRRSYHLLRYSDQALQYGEIKDDQKSSQWLTQAQYSLQQIVEQATVSKSQDSYNLQKYRKLYGEVRALLASRPVVHPR